MRSSCHPIRSAYIVLQAEYDPRSVGDLRATAMAHFRSGLSGRVDAAAGWLLLRVLSLKWCLMGRDGEKKAQRFLLLLAVKIFDALVSEWNSLSPLSPISRAGRPPSTACPHFQKSPTWSGQGTKVIEDGAGGAFQILQRPTCSGKNGQSRTRLSSPKNDLVLGRALICSSPTPERASRET